MAETVPSPAPDAPDVTPPWLDKGLWVAVLTPLCAFLAAKVGFWIDPMVLTASLLPLVAYVWGHKYKTAQLRAARINAAAAVTTQAQAAAVLRGG